MLAAVRHTARRYDIREELFDDFLNSMRMDLTVTDYPDRAALNGYMKGSAEAIGLQVLPILGTIGPADEAAPHAAALGRAFQLTNFLRDIDEDLIRQRVYLPADELAAHQCGSRRADVVPPQPPDRSPGAQRSGRAARRRPAGLPVRRHGVAMLEPRSRPCVGDRADALLGDPRPHRRLDFAVFTQRATVGNGRRLRVASAGLLRSWRARPTPAARVIAEPVRRNGSLAISDRSRLRAWRSRLPLEIFGPGVYRQAWRAARAVLPVRPCFRALGRGGDRGTHVDVQPGLRHRRRTSRSRMPIEEVLFFLVIPLCALLTYNAVSAYSSGSTRR